MPPKRRREKIQPCSRQQLELPWPASRSSSLDESPTLALPLHAAIAPASLRSRPHSAGELQFSSLLRQVPLRTFQSAVPRLRHDSQVILHASLLWLHLVPCA